MSSPFLVGGEELEEPTAHPFFPGKNGEPGPLVSRIHVTRQSATGPIWSPRAFRPSEMVDLQTLQHLFGGGSYILQARDANGQLCGQYKVNLEGAQKSLSGETVSPPASALVPHAAAESSTLGMMMQMMQQNSQLMMQMMMESSKQNMTLLASMLSRGDAQQATMMQVMAENSRASQQSQADFFRHLSEMRGKDQTGGGNIAAFKEGMDLGTTITDIVKKQDDDGGIASTVGALMQGFGALKQAQAGVEVPSG